MAAIVENSRRQSQMIVNATFTYFDGSNLNIDIPIELPKTEDEIQKIITDLATELENEIPK